MRRPVFILILIACPALAAAASASAAVAADADAPASTHVNSIGMEFVLIQAGTFQMGSTAEEVAAACARGAPRDDGKACLKLREREQPRHEVTLSKPFYLGKYEVTQAQWRAVMRENPGVFEGDDLPAHGVSWRYALEFIRGLNAREGHERYRLPTEAEWEYAARAGTTTAYFFGDDPAELGRYAWFGNNAGAEPHPVGHKEPNPWGLFDIYGNVWEWTRDWYHPRGYPNRPLQDPRPAKLPIRHYDRHALRGCAWGNPASVCRSAERHDNDELPYVSRHFGIRLAMDVPVVEAPVADSADLYRRCRKKCADDRAECLEEARQNTEHPGRCLERRCEERCERLALDMERKERAALQKRPAPPERTPEAAPENAGPDNGEASAPLSPECMNRCFDEQSACLSACKEGETCSALCGNLLNACLADCGERAAAEKPKKGRSR